MGFTIDIQGDLGARMDEIEDTVKQVVQDELTVFGDDTVAMAKNLAPVNFGTLRQLIGSTPLPGEIGVLLFANAPYSGFIEFGTGVFAAAYVPSLDPEIQAYAMTFFVNGKGRLPARPFLFPAIEIQRKALIDRLKAQLG